MSNAAELEGMIERACAQSDEVAIDLRGVRFLSSSAITVFLRCRKRHAGTNLSIIATAEGAPHRLLTLVGVDRIIPMSTHAMEPRS